VKSTVPRIVEKVKSLQLNLAVSLTVY